MTNKNSFRSQVMQSAHKIYNADNDVKTWSEALKLAWSRYRLTKTIQDNEFATITFAKATGEVRTAKATLPYLFKGRISSPYQFTFIERLLNGDTQIRSLDLRRLIEVIPATHCINLITQIVSIAA